MKAVAGRPRHDRPRRTAFRAVIPQMDEDPAAGFAEILSW
jgi:hypothetical protein